MLYVRMPMLQIAAMPNKYSFRTSSERLAFDVQLKAVLKRRDGTAKADWDVGIALDVFEAANQCDTIVLASGDGDFGILLDRIRDRFKNTVRGIWRSSVDV